VLVTSSHSALIEVITDAPSIHTLKSRLPQGTSLHDHFRARYGTFPLAALLLQRLTAVPQATTRPPSAPRSATS